MYLMMECLTNITINILEFYSITLIVGTINIDPTISDYKMGIQIGSLILALHMIINYGVREWINKNWREWNEKRKRTDYEYTFIGANVISIILYLSAINFRSTWLISFTILFSAPLLSNLQLFL